MSSNTVRLDTIVSVNHYSGEVECGYGCGNTAEYRVMGKESTVHHQFFGCRSCLNENGIYPIDNEWVSPLEELDDGM